MKKQRRIKKESFRKRFRRFFCRYINGTKGVISLFLAILMVPFVSIAGVLINAARINSAIAIFDEALCNASNSTLGTYDKFLKERFGLLAMSQNTAAGGNSYTVQDLISETFQFYMEQNLEVLSNTYQNSETSASGIYPLSDTDVLLAEVMEYSKYTVPTKMVIDGFSIDSILKKLTGDLDLVGSIFDTIGSGAKMATKMDTLQKNMDDLIEKLKTATDKKTDYDSTFGDFTGSVNEYNALVDEMNAELAKCQAKIDAAQAAYNAAAAAAVSDDGEAAAAAAEALAQAEAALEEAKQEYEATKAKYHALLIPKRAAVKTDKTSYVDALTALADAVKNAGEATVAAQKSVTDAINGGVSLVDDIFSTMQEGKKASIDKNTETLEAYKKDAELRGDTDAVYRWDQQIQENKATKVDTDNITKVTSATLTAGSTAMGELDQFAQREYQQQYSELYGKIIELRNQVRDGYVVPEEDVRTAETVPFYIPVNFPQSVQDVQDLMSNLNEEIQHSSFFATIKALIGFIKAMFSLTFWYDPELCATIDGSFYSSIGGLPSQKDRSLYPITSEFQDGDKQQSEYYKSIMGAYSTSALNAGSVNAFESTINAIKVDIDTISTSASEMKWHNIFSKIGEIASALFSLGQKLGYLILQMAEVLASAAYEKLLLSGYIGYNIPNRTTYSGKGLTGKGYSLPSWTGGSQSTAFNGAETEYIIMGGASETANQTWIFHIVYLLRLITDAIPVALNSEVGSIASAAGAATFGVGTAIVYLLYILAEPLVDTLILVNGGNVPIIKSKAYLTPSGIPDMAQAFVHLKLTDAQKNHVYNQSIYALQDVFPDADFSETFGESAAGGSELLKMFTIDYTQMLIITMLFIDTNGLLTRLGDVIQMEAAYNASEGRIDTYGFDLDKSFTYLRASGSFTANEFIQLSDSGGLSSTQRIVYRGY